MSKRQALYIATILFFSLIAKVAHADKKIEVICNNSPDGRFLITDLSLDRKVLSLGFRSITSPDYKLIKFRRTSGPSDDGWATGISSYILSHKNRVISFNKAHS